MKILAIIPARMGSSRFPGKPMAKIHGKPMIGHVYERVSKCNLLTKTVVATCDEKIYNYINEVIKNKASKIKDDQGVIYVGNSKILKEICPGVFGKISPVGYCMIGKR